MFNHTEVKLRSAKLIEFFVLIDYLLKNTKFDISSICIYSYYNYFYRQDGNIVAVIVKSGWVTIPRRHTVARCIPVEKEDNRLYIFYYFSEIFSNNCPFNKAQFISYI